MEVLTTTEMERADRLTIAAGTPGFALMMSAGQAVAEAAMGLVEEGPIMVVAGRGNNGGDGFVAAAELAARGRDVSVILLCERDSLKGDAALAARGWKYPVLPFNPQAIGKPALIIDALFGAGLNRPVKGDPLEMIEAVNANGAPVLAVDLPSGINGTTGAVMGAAINAVETVTFFRRKPAHLLMPGRKHCGHVRVADIGINARVLEEIRPQTSENVPQSWQKSFPVPDIDGHKYARGHAVVLSGDLASTGAARLAARGALRAGAGLVTLAAAVSMLFFASWGLNYRRVPLREKVPFEGGRVTPDAALALARETVARLGSTYDAAHREGWPAPGDVSQALAVSFSRTSASLGLPATVVPGRPKRSLFDLFFRRAGVAGMTDPFFLETLVASDLLPFERSEVVAHEWAHLAGITDEGEANFVGWLTCVRGTPAQQYSGWLFLYSEVVVTLPRDAARDISAHLAPGPRADLQAIRERYEREVSPRVSSAGWQVYDQYLKANRVEAGNQSYAEVVRLILGTNLR